MKYKIEMDELPEYEGRAVMPIAFKKPDKGQLYIDSNGQLRRVMIRVEYPRLIVEVQPKEDCQ